MQLYKKRSLLQRISIDMSRHKWKYFMMIPIIIYFIVFCYKPMYGLIIAFKNYRPTLGIAGSDWVGFRHFSRFINGYYFERTLRNTFLISFYNILWGFPAPILLALMLNELRSNKFKRVVQSISYIPHFISAVVICTMIRQFSLSDGVFNDIAAIFGLPRSSLLQSAGNFRTIHVVSSIWQEIGWGSIIYIAALTGIDPQLYEAAEIDGAGHLRQIIHVTLPGIMPTIVMLFILRMGSILSVGYEKILLLYNEGIYETADVISTYVYRTGLGDGNFSYSSAVGLFNSVINIFFLLATNFISKKVTDIGLF